MRKGTRITEITQRQFHLALNVANLLAGRIREGRSIPLERVRKFRAYQDLDNPKGVIIEMEMEPDLDNPDGAIVDARLRPEARDARPQ